MLLVSPHREQPILQKTKTEWIDFCRSTACDINIVRSSYCSCFCYEDDTRMFSQQIRLYILLIILSAESFGEFTSSNEVSGDNSCPFCA
eukprot:m.151059 g.151059  ORF g.151059 m.151059 type:complete len:89 (-) comp13289_c2_seq1:2742-3008(-)